MAAQEPTYFAYLLRLWRVDDGEVSVWRASLQRPGDQIRRGFANLEELFVYLRSQTDLSPGSDGAPGVEGSADK